MAETIGRYRITGELGKGGMGVVYKATDPNIGRAVAIKTVRMDVHGNEGETLLRRFKNEARSAGTLNHPNVVTIYDAGEQDGTFYIAMEYVEGETLDAILRRQRLLPLEQVTDIVRQMCAALDYAHAQGVVHRDVKPANIMLTPNGTVKVMDFGVAKLSTGMTTTGQVVGTPNYMSPEQVTGKRLDGRSDLFSVGVMLYEMLTGERPFDGQSVTTIMYKIVNEMPIPPLQLDVTIHPALSAIVTKALSKSPHERYPSGAELVQDVLNYKTLVMPAPPPPEAAGGEATVTLSPTAAFNAAAVNAAIAAGAAAAPAPQASAPPQVSASPPAAKPVAAPRPQAKPKPAAAAPKANKSSTSGIVIAAVVVVLVGGVVLARRQRQTPQAPVAVVQQPAAVEAQQPPTQQRAPAGPQAAPAQSTPPPATVEGKPSPAVSEPARAAEAAAKPPRAKKPVTTAKAAPPPPRPAATPAPAAPVTGTVRVTSTPAGATVSIDGGTQGGWVTPFESPQLKPGSHKVAVAKPGFKAGERSVDVVAGKQLSLDVPLAPAGAVLGIQSDPPGAAILIDNKPTEHFTPAQVPIAKGPHKVKLRLQGYADENLEVRVSNDQLYALAPKLKPAKESGFKKLFGGGATPEKMGTLAVQTHPPGARIMINNAAAPNVTPASISLKEGKYELRIVMPGYKSITRSVQVERGKTLGIEETLEKGE